MRLRLSAFTVVALWLGLFHAAFAGAANGPCDLPPSLQRGLASKYPGARLVSLQDLSEETRGLFQKDHGKDCPGLVEVDFYGDGKPTLALVLIVNSGGNLSTELVVAHEVAQRWKTVSMDKAKSTIAVVWSQRPGEYEDVYGEKKIRATGPVIVFCEYNAWAILYAWTGGRADKIWLRD